jgi:hypothetical protein
MIVGRAPVAQRIEQVPSKHLVAGSIPAGRTPDIRVAVYEAFPARPAPASTQVIEIRRHG